MKINNFLFTLHCSDFLVLILSISLPHVETKFLSSNLSSSPPLLLSPHNEGGLQYKTITSGKFISGIWEFQTEHSGRDFRLKNKEELDIHHQTCEMYQYSLCTYRHKRLSELKSHCKNKHTKNTIIRHYKMEIIFRKFPGKKV